MCPTVAQYHYLLGVALMLAGDMVEATSRSSGPTGSSRTRRTRSSPPVLALNSRKMFSEARPYLTRGLELEPDNLDAVAALAETEEGLGDLERPRP